jgi:hypothetical protein
MTPEIMKYKQTAESFITKESKQYNGDGEVCYPYSFGYALSEMYWTLENLQLNKRQLKKLGELTKRLERDRDATV